MLVTFQDLLSKLLFLCLSVRTITESMTLLIGLSRYIQTIFITQIIPDWIIGIMTSADSIDVQTLHHLNILDHALTTDHIASIRI